MDYIGSKIKLNAWIFQIIKNVVKQPNEYTFLDACSGSGTVSQHASNMGFNVVSTDIMQFPSVIINGSIGITNEQKNSAEKIIEHMNHLKGIDGYFYHNFSDKSIPPRTYFTSKNASHIDDIRKKIKEIKNDKIRDYLLYCGIEAMSRVSNTTGVQAAFLKKFKSRALDNLEIRQEKTFNGQAKSFCCDILELLKNNKFRDNHKEDILYIDPPYNHRQYGPNYHLYETFVKDDNPTPAGKTGLRNWKNESNSKFCSKKLCLNFLKSILQSTRASVVFISYNSDGILTPDDMNCFPNVVIHKKTQRRYKSDTSLDRTYNEEELIEYLFEIRLQE